MRRREFVTASTSAIGLGAGLYGLHRARAFEDPAVRNPLKRPQNGAEGGVPVDGPNPTPKPVPRGETRPGRLLSGISPQSFSDEYIDAFETWVGVRQAVLVFFKYMEQSDAGIDQTIRLMEGIWSRGSVPMMFWQPNYGEAEGTEQHVAERVAAGDYDDEIGAWADALAAWAIRPVGEPDRRVYLNLAPEMNGDWVPWGIPSEHTTAEGYVGMFQRVHDIVMSTGLRSDHVQWVWEVNRSSTGEVDIEAIYPGDDYVDWVGVTGYVREGWGGWRSPDRLFGKMIRTIRGFSDKPLVIGEFGADAVCGDDRCPERKNQWISQMYDFMLDNDVRLACWFEHFDDRYDIDWAVFGSSDGPSEFRHGGKVYKTYNSYRQAVRRDGVLGAHPVDARRLTDEEFGGSFPVPLATDV